MSFSRQSTAHITDPAIQMEETKEEVVEANSDKRSSEESFAWEEWTVIDRGEAPKNRINTRMSVASSIASSEPQSDGENTSDAEEAKEFIEVLPEKKAEQSPPVESNEETVEQPNDESDGVSVITESDVEEPVAEPSERAIVVYSSIPRAPVERQDGGPERIFLKVLNVMIACSLVAVIGLGAGRVLNTDDNHQISTELDLVSIKMENSRLLEQMKELSGVKEILEEIKLGMLQERTPDATKPENPPENSAKKLPHLKKLYKGLDPSINKSNISQSERLQMFLRTICLVLEDIRQSDGKTKDGESSCETQSHFSDLKNLYKVLNGVIDQLEPSVKLAHQRFLQNVKFQMNSMSDALVSDLTQALDKLSAKNQKRLAKIGFKLNERLCILRNTLASDNKLRESLEKNTTFLDNCDEIASRKAEEKWMGSSPQSGPSPMDETKKLKKRDAVNYNTDKKSRDPSPKKRNATKTDKAEARKCYGNKTPRFVHESSDSEDTCATLMAPPRSNWKLKQKSFKNESSKDRKDETNKKRRASTEEWSGKVVLKEDRGASRVWKKKPSKDFEKSKVRRTADSSHENDDVVQTTKTAKDKFNENTRSEAILTEPPVTNTDRTSKRTHPSESSTKKSDYRYKKTYPSNPPAHRVKKNYEKEDNEFIIVERRADDTKVESDWQFERSRIRNQMRGEEASGNWYLDRMSNRKSSRLNCGGENRDSRCDMSHH